MLFQHNVESTSGSGTPNMRPRHWHRAYSRGQYERMLRYEAEVCRAAKKIIAVSGADADAMHSLYGATACAPCLPAWTWNISLRRATVPPIRIWFFSAPWTGGRISMASTGLSPTSFR